MSASRVMLKNVRINKQLSEETTCFSATVYLDGKKVGEVMNRGDGGPDTYHPWQLGETIEAIAKTLPDHVSRFGTLSMSADLLIGDLVEAFEIDRDYKRFIGKAGRVAFIEKGQCFTIMSKDPVRTIARIKGEQPTRIVLNELPFEEGKALYAQATTV